MIFRFNLYLFIQFQLKTMMGRLFECLSLMNSNDLRLLNNNDFLFLDSVSCLRLKQRRISSCPFQFLCFISAFIPFTQIVRIEMSSCHSRFTPVITSDSISFNLGYVFKRICVCTIGSTKR